MPVTKVSGALLKRMLINGAINLKNNYKEVDALNVFPVPDGDTGTNMQMTIMVGVREIENADVKKISELLKMLSRGLLMGARGNSGVILSQFFRGIFDTLKDTKNGTITLQEFQQSLVGGYKMAYKAVMEPVEGTILTVVREAAEALEEKMAEINDLETLLKVYLAAAKEALSRTPELLPVLKEAGVVDSGGAGFVKIVEGMLLMVQGKKLELLEEESKEKNESEFQSTDIKYGYCTEFICELREPDKFEEADLRDILLSMGDSLVLVQDDSLVKVHVHVNRPGDVLNLALQYGDIVTTKIENMRLQHSALIEAEAKPTVKERKEYAIIAVCFGQGIKDSFKELGVDYIIDGGQTMNPATEDFIKAIDEVNADNIIIIPNNSNVILAAEQAASMVSDSNIVVLKAKTIAAGYASLMVFDSTSDINTNFEEMSSAINRMKAGEVTYAVRDTELKGVKIQSGDFIGISKGEIVVSVPERVEATKTLIEKMLDDESEIVTIFYGNDVSEDEINIIAEFVNEVNDEVEVEVVSGKQDIYSYIIAVE